MVEHNHPRGCFFISCLHSTSLSAAHGVISLNYLPYLLHSLMSKVCFCTNKEPIFFLRFFKAMRCRAVSWVSGSGRFKGPCCLFTNQLLDPWRRRQHYPSKRRELLTQDTAWHPKTETSCATWLWQPQNSHPVVIRINSSIPGRLSQLQNTTCGICDVLLPAVPLLHRCRLVSWTLVQEFYICSKDHNYCG